MTDGLALISIKFFFREVVDRSLTARASPDSAKPRPKRFVRRQRLPPHGDRRRAPRLGDASELRRPVFQARMRSSLWFRTPRAAIDIRLVRHKGARGSGRVAKSANHRAPGDRIERAENSARRGHAGGRGPACAAPTAWGIPSRCVERAPRHRRLAATSNLAPIGTLGAWASAHPVGPARRCFGASSALPRIPD